jgi:hypothetical protein
MGRLTLNVLLSFAQFEQEVTSERIRDKISASKRKGLWHGSRTRSNIAFWTGQCGDAREALRLFQALLPDQVRVLGADHPNTLTTPTTSLAGPAGAAPLGYDTKGRKIAVKDAEAKRVRTISAAILCSAGPRIGD